MNARYYDSKIARFLSEDTYTGDPNDPLSLNQYTYCHNEPIMYTDPTGHWEVGDSDRSAAAQAQILDATKAYIEAKASGDTEGMAAARQKAQDARSGNIYQDNSRVSSTSIASELSAVLSSNYVTQAARNDARSSDMSLAGSSSASHDPDTRKEQTSIINTINQARKDTNNLNSNTGISLSLDDVYRYSFGIGLYNNMNRGNTDKNILSRIMPDLLYKSQYAPSPQQTLLIARQLFGEEAYQALIERDKQNTHSFFGSLGFVSDVADACDGLLYAVEGDFDNAKWSLGAMIPVAGSLLKPAKKIIKGAKEVKYVNIDTETANAFISEGSPIRYQLKSFVNGKQMVMTNTAVGEFKNIVSGVGGPLEQARAERFLNRVMVIPDNPSSRSLGLQTTKKVGANDIIIFGTGDKMGITTMTADAKFVRGAQAQGINFDVFIHNPVPLNKK